MIQLGPAFYVWGNNLCLLMGLFRPFILNVIMDTIKSIIFLFVFYVSHLVLVPFPLFLCLCLDLLTIFMIPLISIASLVAITLFYFSGCFRVYNIHLWFITVFLQVILYHAVHIIKTSERHTFAAALLIFCAPVIHFTFYDWILNPTLLHGCYFLFK